MASEKPKRELPSALKKTLDLDIKITKEFVEAVKNKVPLQNYRQHMKMLEISCHGIPWLALCMLGLYSFDRPELWVNLLVALLLDIVVVAVTKAFTRRRRPAYNVDDMFMTGSVDKFSFPSGHATRAILLAVFLCSLYPLNFIFFLPIVAWSLTVCVSRVLLGRHHILDVTGGIVIGLLEAFVVKQIWLSEDSARYIITALGGEDPWSGA
eukprot:TRINITY_DN8328_c0_g1_i17.p1 TRINITY_DN8328_c0_g1~~TRINITY_DN8328_c0_g1_i17.p1  ORF type:complete len:210 (-),score=13.30 TRINITY_DN8328_c0_g1_i17:176-805(-)